MAITTSPTSPVAGSSVTLSSSLDTGVAADALVIELTSLPDASTLSLGYVTNNSALDDQATSALEIAASENDTASFTPDEPGGYGVTIYLFTRVAAIGEESPRWRLKASESATIDIGGYVDLDILTDLGDGATLRLTIVGSTITGAALRDFVNDKSRVAALRSDVISRLSDIESTAVSTALGSIITRVDDLRTELEDHFASTTWHTVADSGNLPELAAPKTIDGAIDVLNQCREAVRGHVLNEGGGYHTNQDLDAVPVIGEAVSLAEATVLLAEVRERLYETHRVRDTGSSPAIHINAGGDTTNALTAATKLDGIITTYLTELTDEDPAVAGGESEGIYDAVHLAGFRIVD